MKEKARSVIFELEGQGYDPMIVSALRTKEEQQRKVEQGVSKTLRSKHLDQGGKGAVAIDVIDRRYDYDDSRAAAQKFFKEYGEAGKAEGLKWGGEFKPIDPKKGYGWDPSHLELEMKEQTNVKEQ